MSIKLFKKNDESIHYEQGQILQLKTGDYFRSTKKINFIKRLE